MQTEHALLLTDTVAQLGNSDLAAAGQVYLPVVQINDIHAPTKKRDYFRVNLTAIIPTDGMPSAVDCGFLLPGAHDCKLIDCHVVLVFENGTIALTHAEIPD